MESKKRKYRGGTANQKEKNILNRSPCFCTLRWGDCLARKKLESDPTGYSENISQRNENLEEVTRTI